MDRRSLASQWRARGFHDGAGHLAKWPGVHHRVVPRHAGVHSPQSGVNAKNQKMILITSPGPAEGKTTVVQNLGIALAESGRKVLLVDADFRRPHLHRKFSLPNEWGLIDLLCEDRPLERILSRTAGRVHRLPRPVHFPQPGDPEQRVQGALFAPAADHSGDAGGSNYDMVIVDAPPILSVADTRIVASLTDA